MRPFKVRISVTADEGQPESMSATLHVVAPDPLSALRPFIDAADDLRPHSDDDAK